MGSSKLDPEIKSHDLTNESCTDAVATYLNLTKDPQQTSIPNANSLKNTAVIFKSLQVWGANTKSLYQPTVTNIFQLIEAIHNLFSPKNKTEKKLLLNGIDGIVREGEMLLVLGRPGSGCTTFLKTIAGFTESFHGWDGEVKYFGVGIEMVKRGLRGDVIYNAEGTFVRYDGHQRRS